MTRLMIAVRRALTLVALAAPVAGAQTINVSTGVDAGGAVLASGAADPLWTMSVAGGPFASALVVHPADECCGMESVDETRARWINNVTDPNATFPNGTPNGWANAPLTVFRRTFDLSGYALSTVALGGVWRLADGGRAYLNGNLLFDSPAIVGGAQNSNNWGTDNPFAVAAGSAYFVAGVNTLEFHAETLNGIYDGLYVDATVSGRLAAVPEPGSVALVATGLVVLLGAARRRRTA